MNWLAVFIGGGLGSLLRYAIGLILPRVDGGFPFATLTVNVLGTLLLAWLMVKFFRPDTDDGRLWILLLGTGLCGAFSTFSAFASEAVVLWRSGSAVPALVYVLVTLSGCIGGMFLILSRVPVR